MEQFGKIDRVYLTPEGKVPFPIPEGKIAFPIPEGYPRGGNVIPQTP